MATRELIDSRLFELKQEEEIASQRAYTERRALRLGEPVNRLPGHTSDLDDAYGNAQDARQTAAELHEKLINGEGRSAIPLELMYLKAASDVIEMGITAGTSTANQATSSAASIAINAGDRLTEMSESYIDQIPPGNIAYLNEYARAARQPGGGNVTFDLARMVLEDGVEAGPQVFGASVAYVAMLNGQTTGEAFSDMHGDMVGGDQNPLQDMWAEASRSELADLGTFDTLNRDYRAALEQTTQGLRGLGAEGGPQLARIIERLDGLQALEPGEQPDSEYLNDFVEMADLRLDEALKQTPGPMALEWVRQTLADEIEKNPVAAAEMLQMSPESSPSALRNRLDNTYLRHSERTERGNDRAESRIARDERRDERRLRRDENQQYRREDLERNFDTLEDPDASWRERTGAWFGTRFQDDPRLEGEAEGTEAAPPEAGAEAQSPPESPQERVQPALDALDGPNVTETTIRDEEALAEQEGMANQMSELRGIQAGESPEPDPRAEINAALKTQARREEQPRAEEVKPVSRELSPNPEAEQQGNETRDEMFARQVAALTPDMSPEEREALNQGMLQRRAQAESDQQAGVEVGSQEDGPYVGDELFGADPGRQRHRADASFRDDPEEGEPWGPSDANGRLSGAPTEMRDIESPIAMDRVPLTTFGRDEPIEPQAPAAQEPAAPAARSAFPEGEIGSGVEEGYADYRVYPGGIVRYQLHDGGDIRTFSRGGNPEAYDSVIDKAFGGTEPVEGASASQVSNIPAANPRQEPPATPAVVEGAPVVEPVPVNPPPQGHTGNSGQSMSPESEMYDGTRAQAETDRRFSLGDPIAQSQERAGDRYQTSEPAPPPTGLEGRTSLPTGLTNFNTEQSQEQIDQAEFDRGRVRAEEETQERVRTGAYVDDATRRESERRFSLGDPLIQSPERPGDLYQTSNVSEEVAQTETDRTVSTAPKEEAVAEVPVSGAEGTNTQVAADAISPAEVEERKEPTPARRHSASESTQAKNAKETTKSPGIETPPNMSGAAAVPHAKDASSNAAANRRVVQLLQEQSRKKDPNSGQASTL